MSLRINKDNIYVIVPDNKYNSFERIGDFMENDFTIFIRAKIEKEGLSSEEESFLFSRNGKHCGISMMIGKNGEIFVNFTYWLNPSIFSQISYRLPKENEDMYNNYVVICSMESKTITFYINGLKVGELDFSSNEKESYVNSFIWLGCGNMIGGNEFNCVGDFDYDLLFFSNKNLSIAEVYDLYENYPTKYVDYNSEYGIPIINNDVPNKESYKMFCDFKNSTKFKLWNMIDNGNYFQRYIDNNIYF